MKNYQIEFDKWLNSPVLSDEEKNELLKRARAGDEIGVELPNGNTVHLHILSVKRA